ncbi:MAG: hypothetical protein ACKVS9_02325 [Phycisphaerae bacterium]
MIVPFKKVERDEVVLLHAEALQRYAVAREKLDRDAARLAMAEAQKLEKDYYDRLPRPVLAACPFCDKPLHRAFDPFGLDGMWWGKSATPPQPPACTHFCLLRGAVNFQGLRPQAGAGEVRPGPEVPYVIPRILNMPEMVMVIGRVEMSPGYVAYPLAYFAKRRPPVQELTAEWARSIHSWRRTSGEVGWEVPSDVWDFELQPWIDAGKVRWCDPASANQKLAPTASGDATACPYASLPGRRGDIAITLSEFREIGEPDGQPFMPIDD